jgi:hypothetical protein
MPISINNGLPNIVFPLGERGSTVVELVALYDTCGSLNSGDRTFHLWLAASYPDIVHEVVFNDGSDGFEPIKLQGAIKESADNNSNQRGVLNTVIRYKTPFSDESGNPMLLSFALGDDVSTNSIFGWPSMLALGMSFNISTFKIYSQVLQHEFHVTQDTGRLGIPMGAQFDLQEFRQRHEAASLLASFRGPPASPVPDGDHASLFESVNVYDSGFLRRSLQPKGSAN